MKKKKNNNDNPYKNIRSTSTKVLEQKSIDELVSMIKEVANDRRYHVCFDWCYFWERCKMKEIKQIVKTLERKIKNYEE